MIHTRICDLLGIPHPIVLGGMGTATSAPLVAAVSNGGGLGTLGTSSLNAAPNFPTRIFFCCFKLMIKL